MISAFLLAFILGSSFPVEEMQESGNGINATSRPNPDQEIATILSAQYKAWNSGDLDGYMSIFWRSPLLVYVSESAVWKGYDEVRANVARQYPQQGLRGVSVLERLQTNIIGDGLATTIEYWTYVFPRGNKVQGITTCTWRKLSEGWKVVEGQTSPTDI
jgi:uncharacterized protein (TIGR02246 family)